MKLEKHALLDALCGEYIVGTLRGPARRRFERAIREEPRVALRLRRWQDMAPRPSPMNEVRPPRRVWDRLETELGLARYRAPWYRRTNLWTAGALVATIVVLLVAFTLQVAHHEPGVVQIAELSAKGDNLRVIAHRSRDGRKLVLRATRPMVADAKQSYELWLIPAEGGDPTSLAVLGALDAEVVVEERYRDRLRAGATLAVSTEPTGGSPTGKPTGPVIVAGRISS